MIEAEELKVEPEKPTETDVERLFTKYFPAMTALQKSLAESKKQLEADGVEVGKLEISIEPEEVSIRVGEYLLWHRVEITHRCIKV